MVILLDMQHMLFSSSLSGFAFSVAKSISPTHRGWNFSVKALLIALHE